MKKYGFGEFEVFFKTLYAECRGEPRLGQEWVGWVIKNRARRNKSDWGGNTIKGGAGAVNPSGLLSISNL